jgi:hypothetical protein
MTTEEKRGKDQKKTVPGSALLLCQRAGVDGRLRKRERGASLLR